MLPIPAKDRNALFQTAQRHHQAGQFDQARALYQRLLLSDPTSAELHLHMSQLAFDSGDRQGCLTALKTALDHAPKAAPLWGRAAERYRHFGLSDAALAAYHKAIKLDPKSLKYRADLAHYQQTLGQFDTAEASFRKLIKANPNEPELYRMFLGTKKLAKGDPLIAQMLGLWRHPRLNDTGRMQLGFALAKTCEDIGAKDKVFGYLNRANAAQFKAAPYDPASRQAEVSAVFAAQDSADLTPHGPQASPRPVFVTGMPRSGTTLVEQIIGRHSTALAGGEMTHALREAYRIFGAAQQMGPIDKTPSGCADWAAGYLRMVQRDLGQEMGVFTDKSIQCHLIFGLIHRALPGARIIVVHRDPRDIALSIYKNHFRLGTHRYGSDLAAIATEIKLFRHSVARWQARLPGVLHVVHYEDLVADPETQARALIAAAGLDWEDACLDSSQTTGEVKTLSLSQVRQPIHAGRRAAWRAYEAELKPFTDAWGDTAWD